MLELVLRHLHNWFVVPNGIHTGRFVIENGSIELPFLMPGQYFRITGSVWNDGIYQYGEATLMDETFEGAVWALAIPQAFLDVVRQIEQWQEQYGSAAASPYTSESFAGYAYTKAAGTSASTASTDSWQAAFKQQLNPWRKI